MAKPRCFDPTQKMRLVTPKLVSDGQIGADPADWRAARALGLPIGRRMPRGENLMSTVISDLPPPQGIL